jgi:hypothetical protein
VPGPLNRNTACLGEWECITSTECYTSPPEFPWENKEKNRFCSECVVSQFHHALKFDFNWPVSWGSEALNHENFVSILTPELLAELRSKQEAMDALEASTTPPDVEGLVRGKDYQNCPKCHKVIHLFEACNHMICRCTASFCYLSGK